MIRVKVQYSKNKYLELTNNEVKKLLENTSSEIIKELQEATPKDTGAAANSWSSNKDKKTSFEVTNDKDYVKYLNAGSSKQAPARFIEQIALTYGTPSGPVVDYE
jgi:HK97 gp10 family phage protein